MASVANAMLTKPVHSLTETDKREYNVNIRVIPVNTGVVFAPVSQSIAWMVET